MNLLWLKVCGPGNMVQPEVDMVAIYFWGCVVPVIMMDRGLINVREAILSRNKYN